MTDTRSRSTQYALGTPAVLLCVTTSDLFALNSAMSECNASGDAACPLSRDGWMNFVEQDFADRLFPFVALHPSDRRKRVPVKALQQFFESGMLIVAHEDRVMFRESLTIVA
jgi:hypothetical protein